MTSMSTRYRYAIDLFIVADESPSATREANIEFETITTVLQREIKGGEGIFGGAGASASTSMREKQWTIAHWHNCTLV